MEETDIDQWSSCQVNDDKSTCLRWFRSVRRTDKRYFQTTERWKDQVEDLKKYSSYQDAVDPDGEAIEFDWTISIGFSSLSILREIQRDLETKSIKSEDFKDRIIFVSMFNDIEWKKNDENWISNTEEVRNYAMRFLQGHWTFLEQDGREMVKRFSRSKRTMELHSHQNGTTIQRNWS